MPLDSHGSTVLNASDCSERLTSAAGFNIGRIAINGTRSPYVIPVNYSVAGSSVLIRLAPGWAAFHLDGVAVTFEVDQVAMFQRSGWSVVLEGVARLLPYDEVGRLGSHLPSPMVMEPGVRVFEISPFKVSGRAVACNFHHEVGTKDDPIPSTQAKSEPSKDLHLEEEAVKELALLLRSALGDLSSEIADTDSPVFRRGLLARRRVLEEIATQLTTIGTV